MPDGADKWVINLRGAFRYVVTGGIVLSAIGGTYAQLDPVFLAMLYDMAGASMSFIIGERMYLNLKGAGKMTVELILGGANLLALLGYFMRTETA
jgi:hypothetical protein